MEIRFFAISLLFYLLIFMHGSLRMMHRVTIYSYELSLTAQQSNSKGHTPCAIILIRTIFRLWQYFSPIKWGMSSETKWKIAMSYQDSNPGLLASYVCALPLSYGSRQNNIDHRYLAMHLGPWHGGSGLAKSDSAPHVLVHSQ